MMVTISLMLGSLTDLILTEYKYKKKLNNFANNEQYIKYKNDKSKFESLSDSVIEDKRIAARQGYIEQVKDDAVIKIIDYSTWLLTSLFFFFIHWRMRKGSSPDLKSE